MASAGIDLSYAQYKGFAAPVDDAINCNVELLFGAISAGIAHIRAGTPQRHPGLPDTPTFGEVGHAEVSMEACMGHCSLPPARRTRSSPSSTRWPPSCRRRNRGTLYRHRARSRSQEPGFALRTKTDLERYANLAKGLAAKVE